MRDGKCSGCPPVLSHTLVPLKKKKIINKSSKLGNMALKEGGVAMAHNEEGLHKGFFALQEQLSSQVEFCHLEVCELQ